MNERRLAILRISPERLVDMAKPGHRLLEVIDHALPVDTQIVGMSGGPDWRYDVSHHEIRIVVRSEQFGIVLLGQPIPELPCPVFRELK